MKSMQILVKLEKIEVLKGILDRLTSGSEFSIKITNRNLKCLNEFNCLWKYFEMFSVERYDDTSSREYPALISYIHICFSREDFLLHIFQAKEIKPSFSAKNFKNLLTFEFLKNEF